MTYDCQIIEDLLPLYVDGRLSEPSRNLVDQHVATCSDCQVLLLSLRASPEEVLAPVPTYDVPITQFSQRIKRYRRRIKWLVGLGLLVTAMLAALITVFLIHSPFDYVSAELGNRARSSKHIRAYLEEGKLPSFLPRQAEEISLTFLETQARVNGKFHLPMAESQAAQAQLLPATVADLSASQEAIPGSYNGVKTQLETNPAGASYFQDDRFVYVFMTDGTVYYYGK